MADDFSHDQIFVKEGTALMRVKEDMMLDMLVAVGQLESLFADLKTLGKDVLARIKEELVHVLQVNIIQPVKDVLQQIKDFGADVIKKVIADIVALKDWSVKGLSQLWDDLKSGTGSWKELWQKTTAIGGALYRIASNGIGDAVRFAKAFFSKLLQFDVNELIDVVKRIASLAINDGATLLAEVEKTLGRMTTDEIAKVKTIWANVSTQLDSIVQSVKSGKREPESMWLDNPTHFPPNFYHFLKDDSGPSVPTSVTGGTATVSPESAASFLYLDVGKWGGGRRDFGIVCGATAVLCEFQTQAAKFKNRSPAPLPASTKKVPVPDKGDQAQLEAMEINQVLEALDAAAPGEPAGTREVSVIRYMRAKTAIPNDQVFFEPNQQRPTVYIFLGDMHIPVVTKAPDDYHVAQVKHAWWDLPAAGENFIRSFQCEDSHHRLFVMDYLPTKAVNLNWWYHNYLQTDGYGYDASIDLVAFVKRVSVAKAKMTKVPDNMVQVSSPAPVLVQLGDMIDLWIGIIRQWQARDESTRVRGADMKGVLAKSYPDANSIIDGMDVATFWGKSAIEKSYSAGFLALNDYAPSVFTWGNHDNYFGLWKPSRLKGRMMEYYRPGHFLAEHGHRWDPNNGDGAQKGNFLTQLLMIGEHSAKIFDDPDIPKLGPDLVRWGEPASRLRQLRDASYLFRERRAGGGQGFCIYVMGHTHDPGLSQFYVRKWKDSDVAGAGTYPWSKKQYTVEGKPK